MNTNIYILLSKIGMMVKPVVPEKYRILINNFFEKFQPLKVKTLNLDVAGCNLKCAMCPRGGLCGLKNNQKGLMDFELFKRIIKKVVDEKYKLGMVQFGNWGESLLNPLFPEMVRYAKSELGPILVSVTTNLTYLKDPAEIIESGLDIMSVSISGMTQEVYSKNHVGGNINVVLSNLKKLIYYKKKLNSNIQLTIFFHDYLYNKKDADLARKFCKNNGIEFFLNRCFISSVEANVNYHKDKKKYTKYLNKFIDLEKEQSLMRTLDDYRKCRIRDIIPIDFDGQLYRCCGVYEEKYLLGSFFDFKIREIEHTRSEICELCIRTPISWR